jgi:lipoate---protein ligase
LLTLYRMETGRIVVHSGTRDLFRNLAFEEYALNHLVERHSILFLWQTDKAVVIGRFQNAYRECDARLAAGEGVQVGRRLSGGGAVYHDEGNLNYSFLSKKENFDLDADYRVILDSLRDWSIRADLSEKRDILVSERKISGNACCHKKAGSMHHGTLLVNSDLGNLHRYLARPPYSVVDRSIASRPAQVENLSRFNAAITVEKLKERIGAQFIGSRPRPVDAEDLAEGPFFDEYLDRLKSRDWIFGYPEKYAIDLEKTGPAGNGKVRFWIEGLSVSRIESMTGNAEFVPGDFPEWKGWIF